MAKIGDSIKGENTTWTIIAMIKDKYVIRNTEGNIVYVEVE